MICQMLQLPNLQYIIFLIMAKRVIIAILVNLFLALSNYTLINLVTRHTKQLDQTSHLRFSYFIGLHAMLFISVIVMIRLQDIYAYIVLGFINCLTASLTLFLCESQVRLIQNSSHYNYRMFTGRVQKLELTFLNVYFLIYMYAIIGLIITSIFLLATELIICWQEYTINSKITQCLTNTFFDETMKDVQCTICLQELQQNEENLIKINICSHLFHEKCLAQWIKHSSTCPLDRKNIFQFQNQQIEIEDIRN